ncbi:cytochrome P450 [Rhodococcus sp. ACS1]|uniref:cytochrome P450 n=1 Tax=Rhodococcus sp. ACS1 TaxID=2028570 RepID=UPI000BB13E26|nr:cytochrome P450 [Rhodococcus sp. ACS1]PBC39304.1 cytochrome P450 [Rhodococcus sp. ACS1]TQC48657.1 cytochrome P450 [Rhodococcus sp. WS4]
MTSGLSPLLTVRRERGHGFAPDSELVRVREAGELPLLGLDFPQYGHFDVTAITRYDDVRELLGSGDVVMGPSSEAETPGTLASIPGYFIYYDGTKHARIRRMVSRWFTVKNIQRLRPRIEEIVNESLDSFEALGSGDFFSQFALHVPTRVICEILGIPTEASRDFQQWTLDILSTSSSPETAIAAVAALREYLRERVVDAKATVETRDDLISALLAENEGEITDEEIVGIAMFVLIAGHETTANAITVGTLALLEHPDQAAAVRDDDSVIRTAVEELFRYLSLAVGVHRMVTRDTTIAGRDFTVGERITFSLLAANNDPALVGNSPELDIFRKPVPHVGFGFGIHQCLGQHLARLELTVAIPAVLRRFPNLRVTVPMAEIEFRRDAPIYGVASLPVAW